MSVGVLVLETDLGTSLLFFGLFVVMLYVATGRRGWIAVGLLLAAAGAVAVGSLEPHVHSRVVDWLHPFASISAGQGAGQLAQSLFAFGAGGLLGTGLGRGHSVLIGFAAKSDFIVATAGEELGLVGLTVLIMLYALLVARGFRAGLAVRDPFGRLLAVGLAAIIALQVFVIVGGVTDLIPLTGHGDALPRPGRLLGGHQLDHRRPADPAQRLRPRAPPDGRRDRDHRRRTTGRRGDQVRGGPVDPTASDPGDPAAP